MATDEHVDVLVVGGGPGGTPAAMALARAGKHVLLVEAGRGLGGTCLFEGCIPSKIFRETAARRHEILRGREFGLRLGAQEPPEIDWARSRTVGHGSSPAGRRAPWPTPGRCLRSTSSSAALDSPAPAPRSSPPLSWSAT